MIIIATLHLTVIQACDTNMTLAIIRTTKRFCFYYILNLFYLFISCLIRLIVQLNCFIQYTYIALSHVLFSFFVWFHWVLCVLGKIKKQQCICPFQSNRSSTRPIASSESRYTSDCSMMGDTGNGSCSDVMTNISNCDASHQVIEIQNCNHSFWKKTHFLRFYIRMWSEAVVRLVNMLKKVPVKTLVFRYYIRSCKSFVIKSLSETNAFCNSTRPSLSCDWNWKVVTLTVLCW